MDKFFRNAHYRKNESENLYAARHGSREGDLQQDSHVQHTEPVSLMKLFGGCENGCQEHRKEKHASAEAERRRQKRYFQQRFEPAVM